MSEVMNGAEALNIENQVKSTKNPFETRFNGHADLIQDEEGFLWRIKEDVDLWMHKPNTVKKSLQSLREAGKKAALQPYWDAGDIDGLIAEASKIKATQLGTSGIPALVDEIFDGQSKLPNNTDFRLNHYPQAELVIKQLLEQGMKASAVVKLFSRPKKDEQGNEVRDSKGKVVLEEAIKIPSIISRRNTIIYGKWVAGETDLQKLATHFKLAMDKIQTIIDAKGK